MHEENLQRILRQRPDVAATLALELLREAPGKNGLSRSDGATLEDLIQKLIAAIEKDSPKSDVDISVIIPVYNEEENLPELYRRLTDTLAPAGKYEIIFVNDGSSDKSVEIIKGLNESDAHIRLINFSRNFGHQAAITAGIDYSRGRAVILMDADLQDPPEVLTKMISLWKEGNEVVYAVRQNRKEFFLKRTAYFTFYRLLQFIANIDIPLDSGDFCLMDKKVVDQLKALPERNRFLRGLRSWVGFKQTALPYERDARHAGATKYSFRKLVKLALDGIVSFSSFPLRLATFIGFFTCSLSIIYLLVAVVAHFIGNPPQGWTSIVAVVLLIGGIQLIILGIIGEYIARIYEESKQRPTYIVRDEG